ncbi:MAG: DUF3048 domain-containing protein [Candidatus Berkelbacteria bacterium]|nr:DUF3048 domain-containing protein [Candidatus Berkelbacteria bacterium]
MKLKSFWNLIWSDKKYKTVFIICACAAFFIIVGAIVANYYSRRPGGLAQSTKKTATAVPQPMVISLLDGMSYPKDLANRHPLAVSVENHPEARPQSGLNKASIVYETMTEGGITRFLAVYGPNEATEIGPIRSARLYFMDWVKEYDAFFAHAGGNEDALANIDNYQIKNLENNTGYFYRDYKGKAVASEHTLYSSTSKLYDFAKSLKFDTSSSSFEALKFKTDGPAENPGKSAEINFSSESYKVNWSFDPNKNIYLRNLAGSPHKDRVTGEQITAKNIVIQTVQRTFQPTGSYGSQNYVYQNVGSGPAYVLQDGKAIKGTWKKTNRDSRTKFYDESGVEIQFNPGPTWYEVIPPEVNPSFS